MPGGLQTEVVRAHPEAFQIMRRSSLTGRLVGARARLLVDPRDQYDILMNGQSLAKVIEKRVRESRLQRYGPAPLHLVGAEGQDGTQPPAQSAAPS